MSDEPCIHLLDPETCTVCNGRDATERKRATTVTYTGTARYAGRIDCGHPVRPGDPIARLANGNLVCGECQP